MTGSDHEHKMRITDRYLSGVSVAAPLIAAVIKWDAENIQEPLRHIFETTKELIDSVLIKTRETHDCEEIQVSHLCVETVAECWSQTGTCDGKEWIDPLSHIAAHTLGNPDQHPQKIYYGFSVVMCAMRSRNLIGDDYLTFHRVCKEISDMCDLALIKVQIITHSNIDVSKTIHTKLHQAGCQLFVSTLECEYSQYINNGYKPSVDPGYIQKPFDIGLCVRHFRLDFENLAQAIYDNAKH